MIIDEDITILSATAPVYDRTVELDADSIVYQVGLAADKLCEGERFACKLLDNRMSKIFEDTVCTKCNVYLGTSTNFRIQLAKMYGYKANRKGKERPTHYDAVRARLISEYQAILISDQEAEDQVGIEAYKYGNFKNFIVGAIDKDMDSISGFRYNYSTRKLYFISPLNALRSFYTQLVTGDKSVDNIGGLYHHLLLDGEEELAKKFRYSRYKSKLVKALGHMSTEMEMWEHVFGIYKEWGQVKRHELSRILETGRLLWIRRYEDEMWVPPACRDWSYLDFEKRILPDEAPH